MQKHVDPVHEPPVNRQQRHSELGIISSVKVKAAEHRFNSANRQCSAGRGYCLDPVLHRQFADRYRRLADLLPLDNWYAQSSVAHRRISDNSRTPPVTRRCVADAAGLTRCAGYRDALCRIAHGIAHEILSCRPAGRTGMAVCRASGCTGVVSGAKYFNFHFVQPNFFIFVPKASNTPKSITFSPESI
ncbi:hypothetical protein HAX54_017129 [Datura stramonium]|uniref:Uncharacterized protein n=1 Tax=Datura stramonium TaxID=4076 RepID=A0ABS8S081_DATST|nr:hypothetical protein [Datura stramonium]